MTYCLKITNLDPIKYELLFERFLNPERISMPDIDIDFCINGRDEVIRYVAEKYGKDNVGQIITFGTMKAKAAIRDVGRVLNMPYGEVDRIAKLIPDELNITIDQALKDAPQLRELVEGDDDVRLLVETASRLEGLARHCGVHAVRQGRRRSPRASEDGFSRITDIDRYRRRSEVNPPVGRPGPRPDEHSIRRF